MRNLRRRMLRAAARQSFKLHVSLANAAGDGPPDGVYFLERGRVMHVPQVSGGAMILPLLPMILPLLPVALQLAQRLYASVAAVFQGSGETAEEQQAHIVDIASRLHSDLATVQAVPQVYTGA